MKLLFSRFTGSLLILAAIFGMLLSIGCTAVIWKVEPKFSRVLVDSANLLDRSLQSTASLLKVADSSLGETTDTIAVLGKAVEEVSNAMESTAAMTESVGKLVGTDMAKMVSQTQNSLTAVESGARLIDDTLRLVAAIPIFGASYKPKTPLQQSIAEVSGSMDLLPESLSSVSSDLQTTSQSFLNISSELQSIQSNIDKIQSEIQTTRRIIKDYQTILQDTQDKLETIRGVLPATVRLTAVGLTLLMVWLLLAQLGLLTQGLEMMRRKQEVNVELIASSEKK